MNGNATDDAKPRFSIKLLLVAIAVCACAFAAIRFAQHVLEVPSDAYAMWAAGDVLLDYMAANDTDWPGSWTELGTYHADSGTGATMVGPFAEMRSRIYIDFTFNPTAVMQAIEKNDVTPDFRVVTLNDGGDTHFSGKDPNQRIFEYLKSQKFPSAGSN